MSNELGPLFSQSKLVILNPADSRQGYRLTGAGSPGFVGMTEATFSDFVITTSQLGTTGLWYGDLPAALFATKEYPMLIYSTAATGFSHVSREAARYLPDPESETTIVTADAELIADTLDARHGAGSWEKNTLSFSVIEQDNVPLASIPTLTATVGHTYISPLFEIEEYDSTGWTAFALIIKANVDTDDDAESLAYIRVSNPAAGDDGMTVFNRRPSPNVSLGELHVSAINPATHIQFELSATGMDLPPSGDTPYDFEIVRWIDDVKTPVGFGKINMIRAASRKVVVQ